MKTRVKRVLSLAVSVLMLLMLLPNSVGLGETTSDTVIPGMELFNSIGTSAGDASTLSISGPTTVKVNEEITLTSDKGSTGTNYSSYWHSWESSNTSIARVSGDGRTATVAGVKEGTVTITHRYAEWDGYRIVWKSETYQVTVSGSQAATVESAQIYYLKTPTSDPNSNAVSQWGRNIGTGSVNTAGATWTDAGSYKKKNIFNPGEYVVSMASGMTKQEDGSWLLPKSGGYMEDYEAIYNAYKTELQSELGITLNSINDIEAIYLTPYKISRNNGTTPDKHIDCTIDVKITGVFVAKFWVTTTDGSVALADAKNYRSGSNVLKTTNAPTNANGSYPAEITIDRFTYVFDGWYNEANEKVSDSNWPYSPNSTELADGTVNFYAHYSLKETKLTVSKTVESNIDADKDQAFTFKYTIDDDEEQSGTFTLKNGGTKTIEHIPLNAKVVVEETGAANFNTTYAVDQGTSASGTTATIADVGNDDHTIAFTNTRKTGGVTVTKTVDSAVTADSEKEFAFTYQIGEGESVSFTLKNGQTKEISGVPVGTKVVVTETTDAAFDTAYVVDGGSSVTGTQATIASVDANGHTIAFTNTRKTGGVTVQKVVTGNIGERDKAYAFSYSYTLNGETKSGTFNLSNGGKYSDLEGLPYGTTVTITETDYSASGYTTTYQVGSAAAVEGLTANVTIDGTNQTVTFTNAREGTPSTGVLLDSLPYILILAAVACIGVVVFIRKRREED